MTSLLTNTSAMVALQTLSKTSMNLAETQNHISTGMKVGSAKDSSSVWAIASVMRSDVRGFEAISESLSLGASTVAVARNGAEQINELLNEIKGKIVAANEDNVDRDKLQTELSSLRDQISGIVSAAQFNGLNLLSNRETDSTTADIVANVQGSGTVNVLASLDRASDGTVSSSSIDVSKQDLGTDDATYGSGTDVAAATTSFSGAGAIADGATGTLTVVGHASLATGDRAGVAVLAGDGYQIDGSVWGLSGDIEYVARDGDTVNDIASGLAEMFKFQLANEGIDDVTVSVSGAAISITNNTGASVTSAVAVSSEGQAGGGLEILGDLDISTEDGATAALTAIEGLSQTAIDAAAAFGTGEKRIEIQGDFVSSLMDSMKSGIGALVDADMEEASARLQALQVQQQLGIQALSIANQSAQNILSLFR